MKLCNKCKEVKEDTEFYKRSDSKGVRSHCKKCMGNYHDLTCTICNTIHTRYSTGRKSDICEKCYPRYRALYNLLFAAKQRANKRKLDFNLTLDWLLTSPLTCPKTGIPFTWEHNGNSYANRMFSTPSIDKIDPSKGYTIDNCIVVCWWYNVSKQQYTDEEVYKLCKQVHTTYEIQHAQNVEK